MRPRQCSIYVSFLLFFVLQANSLFAATDARLINAVKKSDAKTVRVLLQSKLDVNSTTADGTTALHWAAEQDNVELANLLIAAGANVKATNDYGISPLTLACINASPAMVGVLLKAGADPNTVFSEGETALMTASRSGNVEVVKLLLNAGANQDAKEPNKGQTATMWAAYEGHDAAVKALVAHESNFKATDKSGYDALMYAVREARNDVVKTLIEAGAAAAGKTPEGMTLLHMAILNKNYDTAAFLIEKGADVNVADRRLGTPLANLIQVRGGRCQGPCSNGQSSEMTSLQLAKVLLEHGANANPVAGPPARSSGYESKSLDVTANLGAVKAEVALKADPSVSSDFYKYAGRLSRNAQDGQGGGGLAYGDAGYDLSALSPVTRAAILAANKAANAASAAGADADADAGAAKPKAPRDAAALGANNVTLFQLTLEHSDLEMAKLLLEHGAKPQGTTGNHKTNLMLAAGIDSGVGLYLGTNREAFELVKLVYSLGDTDVNAKDDLGSTPLHAAAQRGYVPLIQFLLEKGARLDAETTFGWNPLDVARGYRDYLGVGRRSMMNLAQQPEIAATIEKLMKDRGLATEHF